MLPEPDAQNIWRLETPGNDGWLRSARPDAADKFYMASADGHVQEPSDLWSTRMDARFRDRLPGVIVDAKGDRFQKTEGFRATKMQNVELEGHERLRNSSGRTPEDRVRDLALDGVDAEILFPNKGLTIWATHDSQFSQAMCRVYNDWAWETFGPYNDTLVPLACLATADLDGAIAEIQRCAALGFRGLSFPCKPVFGPPNHEDLNYNLREFEPLWDCVEDVDLPITFHVSTGRDPRTARSQGGAVINYTVHSLAPTMEPIVNICASGVAERHPKLRFGSVEAGIGWVAWALTAMDEAYRKHHMWVKPKLELLPSEYFHRQGFATFQEDKPGLDLAREHGLVDNFLWANDFPHHEGTWPFSAQAIERTMGDLDDAERAKILGLNMARIFRMPIPERYLHHADAAATQAGIAVGDVIVSDRTLRGKVAVVGVAETEYYRWGQSPDPEFKLAIEAVLKACADAGVDPRDVDGFSSYSNDRSEASRLSAALGCRELSFAAMQWGGGGGGGSGAIANAAAAIATGQAECVVVFRALAQGQFGRFGQGPRSKSVSGPAAHTLPYGLMSAGQMFAMKVNRYMHDHGVQQEALRAISLASYAHAQNNPRAVMYGRPLDAESYDASRWIVEPFHLFDCCQENDGAAAMVLVAAERAKDFPHDPCYVLAAVSGSQHRAGAPVHNTPEYASSGFTTVAPRLYDMAKLGPGDVDVLQSYENFTGGVLMSIVEHGFCKPDEVNDFLVLDNLLAPGGKLPLNTSGGNLAECYMHGLGLNIEAVRQIRGQSTSQVPGADVALVASGPMVTPVSSSVFGSEATL